MEDFRRTDLVPVSLMDLMLGISFHASSFMEIVAAMLLGLLAATVDRLAGLVVKASDSGAEDPGFESRLRRDFFRVESHH